jgi:hypothetical protein
MRRWYFHHAIANAAKTNEAVMVPVALIPTILFLQLAPTNLLQIQRLEICLTRFSTRFIHLYFIANVSFKTLQTNGLRNFYWSAFFHTPSHVAASSSPTPATFFVDTRTHCAQPTTVHESQSSGLACCPAAASHRIA